MSSFHETTITGDCPISVRDYGGAGAPVLLLHGALRNLEDWSPYPDLLGKGARLVAMDFRNHGRSGEGPWTWDAVLDDVGRVIDIMGLDAPVLVGHSLGGMVAALYAVRRGGVSGVINMDGYGSGRPQQYLGIAPDVASEYLRTSLDAAISSWPDGSLEPETITAIVTAQATQAAAYGLPVSREVTALARSLRSDDHGRPTLSMSRDRLSEMMQVLTSLDWMDVFARVDVPFLLHRCEDTAGIEGETLEMMTAYNQGLRRDLNDLNRVSDTVTVRFLAENHGYNLIDPEARATEIREFLSLD